MNIARADLEIPDKPDHPTALILTAIRTDGQREQLVFEDTALRQLVRVVQDLKDQHGGLAAFQ